MKTTEYGLGGSILTPKVDKKCFKPLYRTFMIVYTPKTVIFTHFLYFSIQNMDKTESVFPGPLPPLCEGQFFAWKFLLGYLTLYEKLLGGIFVEHEIHFREPIARPVHLTER